MSDELTKVCTKCGERKQLVAFYRRKESRDGRWSYCVACALLAKRRYYSMNPEVKRAESRRYYTKYPDRKRQRAIRYLAKNPDVFRKAGRRRRARIIVSEMSCAAILLAKLVSEPSQ